MINNLNIYNKIDIKYILDKKSSKKITGFATIDKPWLKYYNEEVRNAKLPESTIYEYIKSKNKDNEEKIAIEFYNTKITYKQLLEKIDKCAKSLVALGVGKNDTVTICMPTTPEFVYMFYALSKIGAVANMIDPRKSMKEIEEYTEEVNSKIFLGIDICQDKYKTLKANTKVKNIITVSPYESFSWPLKTILKLKDTISNKSDNLKSISWENFINLGKNIDIVKPITYEKNMPVVIVHTGGTTGKSKGVILSNDTINSGAFQCEISGLNFKDKGTWMDIMPPFIAYGVGNGLHLPLSMGMKVILIPKFEPQKFDEILLKYKPNYMAGVPSHYGYLLKSNKLQNADLSFIKTPIVGGDKMDYVLEEQVNKFLKEHNCSTKIIKGYGMSEVNAAVSVCINGEINKLKSVGIPLSHCNIGIFDPETNKELPYNTDGEVRISGPNVMVGYYNNKEEEQKVLHVDEFGTKWIYSGDLGSIDEDGHLFVKGRYKEMLIRPDGFKVYPGQIEEVILSHPNVRECKVVNCRDYREAQGELPKAFILLKETEKDKETIKEEIKELCEKNLAEYSLPFEYEIRDSFPLTSIGKIDVLALKKETEQNLSVHKKILKKQ